MCLLYNIFNNMFYDDVYSWLEKDFKKGKLNNNAGIYVYLALFFFFWLLILGILLKRKPYSLVSNFSNLPDPILTPISGSTELKVLWHDIQIDFLESYDLNWKVIMVNDFDWVSDVSNKLSPKDFVLWWWTLWIQENIDKFIWRSDLWDMVVYPDLKPWNEEWFRDFIWKNSYSNNRFISSNKKTKLLLNKIDEWDYIRIKWYLANVHFKDGWWNWWPSCVTRVNQQCEVIYVTDVSWLKEM